MPQCLQPDLEHHHHHHHHGVIIITIIIIIIIIKFAKPPAECRPWHASPARQPWPSTRASSGVYEAIAGSGSTQTRLKL
eukprot:1106306-Rhodomonas_salina.4